MSKTPVLNLTMTLMWEHDADYQFINGLRTQHYPPELLFNPAHTGLFTRVTVPPQLFDQIKNDIIEVAGQQVPFRFDFECAPALWGKCVVLGIVSDQLEYLREELNRRWAPTGTVNRSETRGYQPHVTVHGRVSAAKARSVYKSVRKSVTVCVRTKGYLHGRAVGIQIWEFIEGQSWRHLASYPFPI